MQYMKPQNVLSGVTLQNVIMQNLKKWYGGEMY